MKRPTQAMMFVLVTSVGWLAPTATARAVEHDDDDIVVATKMAMWTTAGVPSTDVDVDSLDGRVVLHGKVYTAAERESAERVARGIAGVKEVRNLVQVVPEPRSDAVEDNDQAVDARVKKALANERGLSGTEIKVGSVNKGVVLLIGKSRTLSEHMLAVETVHAVRGVRYVATQVSGPKGYSNEEIGGGKADNSKADNSKADNSKADTGKADTGKADNSKADSGTHHGRGYLTNAVKLRLFADPAVPALDVSVDARGGMIILFGTVPTEAAKAAAERDALKVSGVDRVLNDLQVVPAAERKAVAAHDTQIKDSVKKALETRDELKKVDVAVKNGVVRLTGSAASSSSRFKATVLARSVPGARAVDNDIEVKQ